MAHPATKQYSYLAQLGILAALCLAGLFIGSIASLIPLLGKIDMAALRNGTSEFMDNLLKPENATLLMWMQFLTTLFLFFVPSLIYAQICHKKPFAHLGFAHRITIPALLMVILIMIASLPMVDLLAQLTEKIPLPKHLFQHFKEIEDNYEKQVGVFTHMKTAGDYMLALMMIGLLPAVFEETLFRGGLQNLLSRWFKQPLLAVLITSVVFSLAHASYFGFLSRVALGFILGWIYYRTGNIWLNILAHFTNNAFIVTAIYISSLHGEQVKASGADQSFPIWMGLLSIAVVVGLFILFEKICKKEIDQPGEEISIPGYNYYNPFESGSDSLKHLN